MPPFDEDDAGDDALGSRGAKPDIVIRSDVQSLHPRGVSIDLGSIDRTATPVFDDVEEGGEPMHELAYGPVED